MSTDFMTRTRQLVHDRAAAGILFHTSYTSPLFTVTPPAGTLRDGKGDVPGEFLLPNGDQAVTVDSWGAQASRMETTLDRLADQIRYPLIRYRDPDGHLLTTSARLSHRHADATWRGARRDLEAAGIPFQQIQDATWENADALLSWFPIALLCGWWHSHIAETDPKKRNTKRKNNTKAVGGDASVAEPFDGYARQSPNARSARVVTSEIIASGVHRRLRMAARVDSLFGPLARTKTDDASESSTDDASESSSLSALGLGSLPPVHASKAPVDVTFDRIEGNWYLSLARLRSFQFTHTDPDIAQAMLVALALLLRAETQLESHLRAGTDLIVNADGSHAHVLYHNANDETFPDYGRDELAAIVTELSAQAGWGGPQDIHLAKDSAILKLLHNAGQEDTDA